MSSSRFRSITCTKGVPAAHQLMAGVLMLYVEGLVARANSSDGLQSFFSAPAGQSRRHAA
jgi:hypothetical protein